MHAQPQLPSPHEVDSPGPGALRSAPRCRIAG